jgi:hypothetical protein
MADLSLAPTDKTTQALSADFSTLPIRDQYAQVKTPTQAREAGLGMFEQQQKSAMDLADKEAQLQVTSAEEKKKAIEGYGQTQQNLMGEYKTQKEKMPFPEFHPTQDNANDLMGLFSVISLVGTAMGASGKNSALGALKSMTGMMKGYREGRADLYVKEKNQFDKDFKTIQLKHEEVAKELNLALQLASTDKEKALAVADVAIATAGSPILREKVRVQGLGEGIKFWNNVATDLQTAANKLEERKLKERELSQRDTSNAISATETYIASDGKTYNINKLKPTEQQLPKDVTIVSKIGSPSSGAGMKASGAQQKIYIDKNILLKEYKQLAKDLEDPTLRKLIDDNRVSSFFTEEGGKVAAQLLQKDIDPRLSEFLMRAAKLRNTYYLDQSGKAVTGAEAMRNYGVVPAAGDTAEKTTQKINQMINGLGSTIAGYQTFYNLPDISKQIEQGASLKPPTQKGENAFALESSGVPRFATRAQAIAAIENGEISADTPMIIEEVSTTTLQRVKK